MLQNVLSGDLAYEDLLRRGAKGPMALTSKGTTKGAGFTCRLEITASTIACLWEQGVDVLKFQVNSNGLLQQSRKEIAHILGPATLYKLNASNIAATAYSDETSPDIERDGTNTAVALAAIKLGHDEEFERIEESLQRVIPNVARVRIRQLRMRRDTLVHTEPVMGSKVFFDFIGAPGVPAHAASEGTLITLALLTILHSPNRPNILLLDDFAESLHPQAQMELVRLVKRVLDEFTDLQIVATTHSPYILDELDPSEVHVFALRDDGTVATKSLAEHPQAAQMKGSITAGQLWSLDPERDWVLTGTAP